MRFGVLGTGIVGQALGGKLIEVGHEVTMGSRQAGNEKAAAWAREAGERAAEGSFADAASSAEAVVNATAGVASLEALEAAGAGNLAGKLLLDVANPLDFSGGMPPTLKFCNDDSLAERIQRAFPEARVVKAFNTVNAEVMGSPALVGDSHTLFMCGEDQAAKDQVRELAQTFGWPAGDILDLGDITAARAMEMYLPMWLRLFAATGTPRVNVNVVVGG